MEDRWADGLVALLAMLEAEHYRFVTVTPATHARFLRKKADRPEARTLRDIFGWNMPFRPALLPAAMLGALREAGALEEKDGLLKSKLRVSSIGARLFLHSSYPTTQDDAVFFGPDTYRFADFVRSTLAGGGSYERIVEIGAGTGAVALIAGALLPGTRITLLDINPRALRLASANAAHAGLEVDLVEGSTLDAVEGPIALILANPPFIMDEEARAYRDGGGQLGSGLSVDWAVSGARRLAPGGRMILYSGAAIVEGVDPLRDRLERELAALKCSLRYHEIDPDIFGEELDAPSYRDVERIAAVGAVIERL